MHETETSTVEAFPDDGAFHSSRRCSESSCPAEYDRILPQYPNNLGV